jgi:hypothetical protein
VVTRGSESGGLTREALVFSGHELKIFARSAHLRRS